MGNLSVGGLVSGLDTTSIIEGLSEIEMTRVTRVKNKQKIVQAQKQAFMDLATRIRGLGTKAESLSKLSTFNIFKSTSNDDEIATITGKENGSSGSFDIQVNKLATAQKTASQSFASSVASLGFAGTIELSRSAESILANPGKTTTSVEIKATDALKDIVNKINAAEGSGVKASLLSLSNGENRLVLTGVDQGSDGFFLRDTTGSVLTNQLGILDTKQSARTEFNFMTIGGNAAEATTLFKDLFTSIGGNNLDNGDAIQIEGLDANGNTVNSTFTIDPETTTIDDLLQNLRTAFGPDTDVSLNQSGEIVLTNVGTGVESVSMTMSFVDQGTASSMSLGSTKEQNTFNNLINEGTKAFYLLDGMAISSQSNQDKKTVVGAQINLKKAEPGTAVKLGLELDKDGIKSKIQEFMDEYNSVMKFIQEKSKVEISDDKDSKDDKQSIESKGPLANDARVRRLKQQLQSLMTSSVKELEGKTQYTSLSRIGISTNRQTGLLEMDDEKIEKAIEGDFDGVKSLFAATGFSTNPQHEMGRFDKATKAGVYEINADTGDFDTLANSDTLFSTGTRTGNVLTSRSGDSKGLSLNAPLGTGSGTFTFSRGIASQLQMFVDSAKDSVSGFFVKTEQSYQKRIEDYDDRIYRLEEHVESFRARLTKQFGALEQSMQRLQSQNSAFLAQMGSL